MRCTKSIFMKGVSCLLVSSLLFGCVPIAFLGGAAIATVISDQRDTKTMILDQNLAQQIQWQLKNQEALGASRINAYAFNRSILLVGKADTSLKRQLALDIARRTPNVRRVYNQVTLGNPASFIKRTEDAWITTQAKTKLLTLEGLKSVHIKVITENRVVYLMGIVSAQHAYDITQALRSLPKVRKIVSVLEQLN